MSGSRLISLIAARYPALAATDQKEYDQFWSAFIYLFFARRADAPNQRVANDTWVEQANSWLLDNGRGFQPTTAKALVAACIVHGIPYSEPPWPKLGLAHGTRSEMQPSAGGRVLEVGQLPAPTAIARVFDGSIGMSDPVERRLMSFWRRYPVMKYGNVAREWLHPLPSGHGPVW